MDFISHQNPLRHQRPTSHGAAAWMTTLYGAPFDEPRSVLVAPSAPAWVDPKDGAPDLDHTHTLVPRWSDIALLMWNDGSCVVAFPKPTGYDVLPATFTLANLVYDHRYKDVAWDKRPTDVPTLHLRADRAGLRWTMVNGTLTDAEMEGIVRDWLWERAAEVVAAGPVLDPRVHLHDEGGRFAPFSPFPEIDGAVLDAVRKVLIAVAPLAQVTSLWIHRPSAASPWRTGNTGITVSGQRAGMMGGISKPWKTWIKAALFGPTGVIPPALRSTTTGGALCHVDVQVDALTAHQKLAAQDALSRLVHPTLLADMPKPMG